MSAQTSTLPVVIKTPTLKERIQRNILIKARQHGLNPWQLSLLRYFEKNQSLRTL